MTFWRIFSWGYWLSWMGAGVAYELFAVKNEKKLGTMPLTRVTRDRIMRGSRPARFGVLLFLAWIDLHFLTKFKW